MHVCLEAAEPWVLCSSDNPEQQSFPPAPYPSAFPVTGVSKHS